MELVNYDLLSIHLVPLKISDITGDDGLWNVCKQPPFGVYYECSFVHRLVLLEISQGKSYLPSPHGWGVYISGAKGWDGLSLPHTLFLPTSYPFPVICSSGDLERTYSSLCGCRCIMCHSEHGSWVWVGSGGFIFWPFCDQRDKNSGFKVCGLKKRGLRESEGAALCF